MGEPRRNLIVQVPSIRVPITRSPGFAKKLLATWKLDLMALCGFGCRYCSSNTGNYLRINRERFADETEKQLGERLYPSTSPDLAMVWPDVLEKLERQVRSAGPQWGAGETLVFSMLTDAFSGPPLHNGTTRKALQLVLDHTAFRIRVLTKNSIVGTSLSWLRYFNDYRGRFVVGLSTGSLDDEWAKRVEVGCPPPSARIRATQQLQAAGVPTFGMLCPIFPDALDRGGVERLVDAIQPNHCEHVWAEPFNDRANWKAVRAGYQEGTFGWRWFTDTYGGGDGAGPRGGRAHWSTYATLLFLRLRDKARAEGWLSKLRYLLYEGEITDHDAESFGSLDGVLLQGPTDDKGRSKHPVFARMQEEARR